MIESIEARRLLTPEFLKTLHTTNKYGTGGMFTKIRAAHIAAKRGTITIVCNGLSEEEGLLTRALNGEDVGTVFLSSEKEINHNTNESFNLLEEFHRANKRKP